MFALINGPLVQPWKHLSQKWGPDTPGGVLTGAANLHPNKLHVVLPILIYQCRINPSPITHSSIQDTQQGKHHMCLFSRWEQLVKRDGNHEKVNNSSPCKCFWFINDLFRRKKFEERFSKKRNGINLPNHEILSIIMIIIIINIKQFLTR